jgi:sigma-E factor negative regulatory protein RseA
MSVPAEEPDTNPMMHALSELMDGEADASSSGRACSAWATDAVLRERWHAWHLIGDVLRSDELSSTPQRDAAFLARLSGRLAKEPVVFAPERALPDARRSLLRRRRWMASAAVAAGFMAVAAAVVVLRGPSVPAAGPTLARAPAVSGAAPLAVAQPAPMPTTRPNEPQVLVVNGQLIRDARLDQYLAEHKQHSAIGIPAGLLRNAPPDAGAQR